MTIMHRTTIPITHMPMVDRFWLPEGAPLAASGAGFLPDPASEYACGCIRRARPSSEIEDMSCLVLTGEPALGKTTALEQEARRIRSARPDDGVRLVDLSATRERSRLWSWIFEAPEWRRWRAGDGRLHLLLDGLDACALPVETIAELLEEGLAEAPSDRLSLRLACRTANRYRGLETWLRRHFGSDRFGVYELLPLRRRDALELATSRLTDPERWLEEVIRSGLEPLAASPMTLTMLLDIAAMRPAPTESRAAVFEAACRLLSEQPTASQRAGRPARAAAARGERFAMAQRIAGLLILSASATVASGAADRNPDASPAADGRAVAETLRSRLFTDADDGRLRFRHRIHGEFLCARCLAGGALGADQIDALLFADTDGGPRVIPQLREVAASLATQSPDFARRLLERDPAVLLRADPSAWDPADRPALVSALLAGVGSGHLGRFEPSLCRALPYLCHPDVAGQLRQVLNDPLADTEVREACADLAGACGLDALEDDLIALGLDPAAPASVRAGAVGALSRFGSADARRQLLGLAVEPTEGDPCDELRGAALSATWPAVLALDRLLASLTKPKRGATCGAYDEFLRGHMVRGLRDDQLAAALDWAATLPSGREAPGTGLSAIRDQLLIRSARRLGDDDVVGAYAAAVSRILAGGGDILPAGERARHPDLLDDAAGRRRLVAALMSDHAGVCDVEPAGLTMSAPPLARADDVEWALAQLVERAGTAEEERWAELVAAMLAQGADEAAVVGARRLSPALARLTAHRHDLRAKVAAAIELWDDGDLDGFSAALALMEEVEPGASSGPITSDPRRLVGWRLVDDDVHEWVLTAAARYLRAASAGPYDWFSERLIHQPACAGYRALRLLRDERPRGRSGLREDVWRRWAAIIVDWPRNGTDEARFNDWAVAELVARAPEEAARWLDAALSRDLADGRGVDAVRRFAGLVAEPVEAVVLKYARSPRAPWRQRAELIDFLLSERSAAGWRHARRLVTPAAVRAAGGRRERAVQVAARLAAHGSDAEWARLWPLITSDDEFGRMLLAKLAAERAHPVGDRLTEAELADLCAWIEMHFPSVRGPIGAWRDRLLRTLAARGTENAVLAFDRLIAMFPELPLLRDMRANAAEGARRPVWTVPDPARLAAMLTADGGRGVTSDARLRTAVVAAPPPGSGATQPNLRLISVAGLALSLLLAFLVVVPVAPAARAIVAFTALFTVPGAAIVTWVRIGDPRAALVTALALSLTVETAVALLMLWTGWWYPGAASAALLVASCAVFVHELHPLRPHAGGPRRGVR